MKYKDNECQNCGESCWRCSHVCKKCWGEGVRPIYKKVPKINSNGRNR